MVIPMARDILASKVRMAEQVGFSEAILEQCLAFGGEIIA